MEQFKSFKGICGSILVVIACSPSHHESKIAATDEGDWATAENSSMRVFPTELPDHRCLSEGACPFQAAELPRCAAGTEARTLSEIVTESAKAGATRKVRVRGRLQQVETEFTQMGCPERAGQRACCNHASGRLGIKQDSHSVAFGEPDGGVAFACRGDESLQCCGFIGVDSVDVIAEGELDSPSRRLLNVRICSLGGT